MANMRPAVRKYLLAALALSVFAPALAMEDPGEQPFIHVLLEVCAITYGHPALVASAVKQFAFAELDGPRASAYLRGHAGQAWAGKIASTHYAVTEEPNGICTVIVHEGDATLIKAAVESWLPPAQSGVVVKKQALESPPGIDRTRYELHGGKVHEIWVLTLSSDPTSTIRAVISWGPANRLLNAD